MPSLKDKTIKGLVWGAVERWATQCVDFVFTVLIARLLLPDDYGIIAMLNIFLAISRTLIDSGFEAALIRKTDRTDTDFSTVFYFNVVASIFCYVILWVLSPHIAGFYNAPLLEQITKIVSLNLVISAFAGIHSAKLVIAIDFKTKTNVSLVHAVISGTVGLVMAYMGYGIWALIVQSVTAAIVRTIALWIAVRWKPSLVFSWQSFKEMFSFGSKLLTAGLLNTFYNNIYSLAIGKFYSPASLGVYSKANTLANLPSTNVMGVFQNVLYPVLSSIQDDKQKLIDIHRRFLRMSCFIVFPMAVGLASVADPLIRLLLTDKWAGCIPLLQVICFSAVWTPIIAVNTNLLKVKGRSDYFLKVEAINRIIGVVILCLTIPFGLVQMCYGVAVATFLSVCLNSYYTKKLIGYGFFSQLKDIASILVLSSVMGGFVLFIMTLFSTDIYRLIIGVSSGVVFYVVGAMLLKIPELKEILSILRKKH